MKSISLMKKTPIMIFEFVSISFLMRYLTFMELSNESLLTFTVIEFVLFITIVFY